MLSTSRSRVRTLAATGMAGVVASIGAVTLAAPAAEAAPAGAAPAADSAPAVVAPAGVDSVAAPAGVAPVAAIPEAIRPPAGSRPVGAYLVVAGTQNYSCVVAPGASTGAYTGPAVPEAQLLGTGGWLHHFAGPSWQSERDGSLVTATKVAASARTGAIPELLLKVLTHTGAGVLSAADYINRLHTSGGVAPAGPCASGETARVPYRAIYVFWHTPAM